MMKPGLGVSARDRGQESGERPLQATPRARFALAQGRFEFAPPLLDRVQIRRVGRQIFHSRPPRLNRLRDACHFMDPEVVHHHNVSRGQGAFRGRDLRVLQQR
jgi:hypothetical protein